MNFEHGIGGLLPVIIWGLFIVAAIRRWTKARAVPPAPPPDAIVPVRPAVSPEQPLARRRLAPPAAVRPAVAPALATPARAPLVPSMADTLPAEAAAAFPGLDLSLPGLPGGTVRRRPLRSVGGGPPIGSPAWAANAIVAAEILGPPVSLRPGATLGAPHAF